MKDPSTQSECTQSLRQILKEVKEVARQNLEKARQKQRESNEEKNRNGVPLPQVI